MKNCSNCRSGKKLDCEASIWCSNHHITTCLDYHCDRWHPATQSIINNLIKDLSSHSRASYLNTARLLRCFLISQGYSSKYVSHLKLRQLSKITDKLLTERRIV